MKYKIALFEGDGVGPEVMHQAVKVIERACELDKFEIEWAKFPHCAEHYMEKKETVDNKVLSLLDGCNAIYCGPFGVPISDSFSPEKHILGPIKQHFGHFAFVKPVKLFPNVESAVKDKTPQDVDFTIIRESTEEFHVGFFGSNKGGKIHHQLEAGGIKLGVDLESEDDITFQAGILSKRRCERIAKFAQGYAKERGISKIISVDKMNSMSFYSEWRDAFSSLDGGIQAEHELIDSAVINFIRQPEKYKIVAAPYLIGDILCDLSNIIHGGFSFSYGAYVNPEKPSMFMPLHGSAAKLREKGIVNPTATILAGAMMLENIGERKSAALIQKAVAAVFREGKARTQDLGGFTTTDEMGDAILDKFIEIHD